MRRRSAIALLLLSLPIAAPARAEIATPEAAILSRVSEVYTGLKRFFFSGSIHVDIQKQGAPQSQHAEFLAAAAPGGKLRDQVDNPAVGGAYVSDGTQAWIFNAGLNQYVHRIGRADSVLAGAAEHGIAGSLIMRYAAITAMATAARRLPDESVTIGGAARPCDVIEVTYPQSTNNAQIHEGPRTYWIDKTSRLVLRQRTKVDADMPQLGGHVEQTETIAFRRAELDPKLADSLWTFHPPAGAKEVQQFETPNADPGATMNGTLAADFTLKDLAGRAHSLKTLRGKVVLLDFWATWCGPCRLTMPRVAKMYQEYKTKGVEVMSVNVGETAAQAGAYMKKNGYTFTTLLDQNRAVALDYKVNGIPTLVVIDRKGTISSYLVGAHEETTLREAIAKAGVK
ncbi:MAG: redoxin domain-containing protein [Candidatus Eisenbacteria bacterium]|uniref:Redoxin domain-containing protein n=1 Tax=Eiseniibacteriota bacterium TaxID=2212470 RepID=A0A9D6L4W8_UNCEI|nr:redoxin domain-containing protein [Candidatus Eisenbacteria bacterium]MBI3538696.1 redoxin domain-containing protein [Candidatus Eisenbacteria bacterium]